jgi:hypothetical protein
MPRKHNAVILLDLLLGVCLLGFIWSQSAVAASHSPPYHNRNSILNSLNQEFLNKLASAGKSKESPVPELYIDPTVKYGLNLILPRPVQKQLNCDTGYDRWEGLPTVSLDYFLALKSWNDKSVFFFPRLSLTGSRETFSIGGGLRQLVTAETMLGFYAFHDWVRPRRLKGEFLKQAGAGMELSALPGRYSDLTISMNAYFPVNERRAVKNEGNVLLTEIMPTGGDLKIGFLLPALTSYLDIRLDGEVHTYRGETTNLTGYKAGLDVRTRDGMLGVQLETRRDSRFGQDHRIEGNLSLAFDWMELVNGRNPFSAPYKALDMRFSRNMRDSLYGKVKRKLDLPMDKSEKKTFLMADVSDSGVYVSGGFPKLPNAWVTIQTSQSPWEDHKEIMTDSSGEFAGKLDLPPGIYRIRMVHKPTGRVSNMKTVVVEEKKTE